MPPAPAFVVPALPLAGRARRLSALIYEGLLLTAIIFIAAFVALPLVTPGHAGTVDTLAIPGLPQRVALFCMLFTVLAWYSVASWAGGRRSLPMKTWRLRLLMADGRPVTRKAAMLRFLATWIGPALAVTAYALLRPWGLGAQAVWLLAFNFLWTYVDREQQFLHDRIAGTRLVQDAPHPPAVRPAA
ncbi:MAG: RDD family protein [Casimicrobiaceae bacterium]